jgi:hypothetical protein
LRYRAHAISDKHQGGNGFDVGLLIFVRKRVPAVAKKNTATELLPAFQAFAAKGVWKDQ